MISIFLFLNDQKVNITHPCKICSWFDSPLNCQTSVSIEFALTMVLLCWRALQFCVRYWSAGAADRLQPCGRWLLTSAVCGRPVQLSSNSIMSDIDSESADFFNDSPNMFYKTDGGKRRKD